MNKQDVLWVDAIKIIATFSVVWLHSAAPLLYKYNELSGADWWAGNVYDSMVRMCVPLFFMLSGYLLLGKKEGLLNFYIKRVRKVLLPLVVWSVFYILWERYYQGGESISFRSIYSLILSPAYFHLWFLYAIIGLYLFVPILRVFVQYSNKGLQYYFVALWFIAVSVIPFLEVITSVDSMIDLKMISGFVGYLVIGYLLGNVEVSNKCFILSSLLFLVTVVFTAVGTYYLTVRNGGVFVEYLYSYRSPNVILMSITSFIMLKYIFYGSRFLETSMLKKVIGLLSSASLGIYFIHAAILYVLHDGSLGFQLSAFSGRAIYAVPLTAIIVFIFSFVIINLLQRIPVVQRIVPT